jgi:hypothetical protein
MGDTDFPAKFTFDQFWNFTEPLEGGIAADCMYMVKDLQVATGMGITFTGKDNRALGLEMAKKLDWVYKPGHPQAGNPCSEPDIARDYDEVLSHPEIGRQGSGHLNEWKAMTNCRITKEGLRKGVRTRVIFNINYMKNHRGRGTSAKTQYLGDFDTFPADAQLCVISLSWSGNEFNFPRFSQACREADWFEASRQCHFKDPEGTVVTRNKQQEEMMRNAGCASLGAEDPEKLHWPTILALPDMNWLYGWWKVWDGNDYFYFFEKAGTVVYIETTPTTSGTPPLPKNFGTYSYVKHQLVVRWRALPGLEAAVETFYNATPGVTEMNANSNLYSPLVATRMS